MSLKKGIKPLNMFPRSTQARAKAVIGRGILAINFLKKPPLILNNYMIFLYTLVIIAHLYEYYYKFDYWGLI